MKWKYLAKDHGALTYLQIFRVLRDSGLSGSQSLSLINQSWGKSIVQKVHKSESAKSTSEIVLEIFEEIFFAVVGRIAQADDAPQHKK